MKNYFYEYNKRNIQKFNVSITFSIMQEILKLIAVLGIIFVACDAYINDKGVSYGIVAILCVILLFKLLLLPGYIAQYKTSPRTTAIFVLGIIVWLLPITWPAALVWACAEPNYDREIEPIDNYKYVIFKIISIVIIALSSLFFYFGLFHSNVKEIYKAKAEVKKIENAVNIYHKEQIKDTAKRFGVSQKCAEDYLNVLKFEGVAEGDFLQCTKDENIAIKNYWKKEAEKASNQEYTGEYIEPLYTNNGMPKSLVLKDVPIMCFEKANLGDNSSCTKKQLNTIKQFFEENKNINWESEYFEY